MYSKHKLSTILVASECYEPFSFFHANILMQNIIEGFLCILSLRIIFMIELTLWDTVSMNLAQ